MNRAHQQALSQQTNQAVLQIRQLEVNYYTTLYGVFGTQGVLVGGFVYNMFTQNNIRPSNLGVDYIKYVYYVSSAITMASSLHIMFTTMLLQVYGPGLALHGPLGSMARATEGLRAEQEHIVKTFIVMIIAFSVSTMTVFWMIMRLPNAIVSSGMYLMVLRQSYYYCERIYLRFYWEEGAKDWNDGRQLSDSLDFDMDEPGAAQRALQDASSPDTHRSSPIVHAGSTNGITGSADNGDRSKKATSPFGAFSFKSKRSEGSPNPSTTNNSPTPGGAVSTVSGVDLGAGTLSSTVTMEGYFTARTRVDRPLLAKLPALVNDADKWVRQYFVLFRTAEFYVYQSRQAFRNDPKRPLYTRAIRLREFYVEVENVDQVTAYELLRSICSFAVQFLCTSGFVCVGSGDVC
jgi:hypothetical protein